MAIGTRPEAATGPGSDDAPHQPDLVRRVPVVTAVAGRLLRPQWWARHGLFVAMLVGGAVLRYVVWRAYRPVLLFPDSGNYLTAARDMRFGAWQPSGYSVFLWPFVQVGHPTLIGLVQHGLGLLLAVAVYAVLVRLRVPTWGAALATLPVLFDPLQLDVEQYVLADVLFQTLLLAAAVAVLWTRRPGSVLLVSAGALVAMATLTRAVGIPVIGVFVLVALLLRVRWVALLLLLLAFVAPVLGYMLGNQATHDTFAITQGGQRMLYARLASTIADCTKVELPAYERPLCPIEPLDRRATANHYMWGWATSPQWQLKPPPGMTQTQVVADFNRRVIRAQRLSYAKLAGEDFLRSFQPRREVLHRDMEIGPFQFHEQYPTHWIQTFLPQLRNKANAKHLFAEEGKTRFLVSYQRWVWTPGPALGLCLLLAVAAALGLGRARRSGLRSAIVLLGGVAVAVQLLPVLSVGFSWRYQLPGLVLLPAAGALGLTALLRRTPDDS